MEPNDTAPESTPKRRGRPPGDPSKLRNCPAVCNLTEDEHARAKAKAAQSDMSLGQWMRAVLLPLIAAVLIVVAPGCGAGAAAGVAGVIAGAKPVLDVACHVVARTCDAVEAACSWAGSGPAPASSGGEASSPAPAPAGVPDAGTDAGE